MTTLPQTIRLPRPTPPQGQLALPQPVPSPLTAAPANPGMTGAEAWRVIRANIWLITLVVILSGAMGVGLYYYLLRYHAQYTATGFIEVRPKFVDLLAPNESANENLRSLEVDQRTQAQLLKNPALIGSVLTNSDEIRETHWFRSFGDKDRVTLAKVELVKELGVAPYPDSRLIAVSFADRNPKDARIVVEAVVNQHLTDRRDAFQREQESRSKLLNEQRRDYKFDLDQIIKELRETSMKLNLDGGGVGRIGIKEMQLSQLVQEHLVAQTEYDDVQSALDGLVQQVEQGREPSQVQAIVDRDPDIQNARWSVKELESHREALLVQLGEEHSVLRTLDRRIAQARKNLDDEIAERKAKTASQLIEQYRQQADAAKVRVDGLNKQVDALKQDLGALTYDHMRYVTLSDQEKTLREVLREVEEKLDTIKLQIRANISGVEWAQHPDTPDEPSFPDLPITVTLCVMAGLGLSLGVSFLREFLDTRVRSPQDIARVGQLNLLGVIPHEDDDPQAAGVLLPLVISESPHSAIAEQFRQVRTRLQHGASLDTTRTVMVTSPGPGDGKSTVACNIAAGLALNGRKILLVDANFRRPELHKVFGHQNDTGFSSALGALEDFESSVHPTRVPNLDVMTSGPRPTSPTELLESQSFVDFIERALEDYDHVVFDGGPLLVTSEAVALAPRVDGVVTVVRAHSNSRGLLQRLRDTLRQVKAEHLGVVLNGVRAQGGGYYGRNIKTHYAYVEQQS